MAGKAGSLSTEQHPTGALARSPYGAELRRESTVTQSDPEQRIECLQSPLKAGEMIPGQQTVERDLSTTAVLKHK